MSNEPVRTDFPAGNFISEDAVRGVFGRRRTTSPTTRGNPVDDVPARTPAAAEYASPSARERRRLRRWSVADLVARALAARTADGMGHG
jgi:hypothetical protein